MSFGVETIGSHDFRTIGNGKVSVSVNNGNLGACLVDEKTANALKEKYRASSDKLEISTKEINKPKMSYEEASVISLTAFSPFGAGFTNQEKLKEAGEALQYYREHGITSKNSKEVTQSNNNEKTENTSLWGKYKKWFYGRTQAYTQNEDVKKLLNSQGGVNLILAQGPMHPYYNMAVMYNLSSEASKNSSV